MPNRTTTLFDTAHPFDAGLVGFDGPTDPHEDGAGFRITAEEAGRYSSVHILGPDGEVTLTGTAEIDQAIDALMAARAIAAREEKRAAEAAVTPPPPAPASWLAVAHSIAA